MKLMKKGISWCFGMKASIGKKTQGSVPRTGRIPANEHDGEPFVGTMEGLVAALRSQRAPGVRLNVAISVNVNIPGFGRE